jgi:hypothetical protein
MFDNTQVHVRNMMPTRVPAQALLVLGQFGIPICEGLRERLLCEELVRSVDVAHNPEAVAATAGIRCKGVRVGAAQSLIELIERTRAVVI